MTEPKGAGWEKTETHRLGRGMAEGSWLATYEHWEKGIEHEHHIHLANGTTITFSHEHSEGGVTIEK